MSKIIAEAAIRGAHKIVERAFEKYEEAVKSLERKWKLGFQILPIICLSFMQF